MIPELQALTPPRHLTRTEALAIAETQAQRLRQLLGVKDAAISDRQLGAIPGIRLEAIAGLKVSGATRNIAGTWIILTDADEPRVRQRFTIAHEIKHILDDAATRKRPSSTPNWLTERICDYFSACLLMPRTHLKRAWVSGLQAETDVATLFDVSVDAARIRLQQVGLVETSQRCHGYAPNVVPLPPRIAA